MEVYILDKEYDCERYETLGAFTSKPKAMAKAKALYPDYDIDWKLWTRREKEYNQGDAIHQDNEDYIRFTIYKMTVE